MWIDSVVVGPERAYAVPREGVTNLIRIHESDEPGTWYKFDAVSAPTTYAQFDPSNVGFTGLEKISTDSLRGPFGTRITWNSASSQFTGIQTQFSLPPYLVNRLVAIEFDYEFTTLSGNRTTANAEVYLIGEDNTLIQLDNLTIPASTGSVQNYRATAVMGTEQKWRLAVMYAGSESGTDQFLIDNVYVGVGAPGVVQAPIATSTEYGVVKKNRWQRKFSGGNVATNITWLQFNELEIGKLYRYTLKAQIRLNDGATAQQLVIGASHDGSTIGTYDQVMRGGAAGNNERAVLSGSDIFEATNTTLSFTTAFASVDAFIVGGSANNHVVLEELNNYEDETTDFT